MLNFQPSDEWYRQLHKDEDGVDVSAGVSGGNPPQDEAQAIRDIIYGPFPADFPDPAEANQLLRKLAELQKNPTPKTHET